MSFSACRAKIGNALELITVEPSMFFYMMAFMTTSVAEEAFFVYKACRVNHKFNATVCNNLSDYPELHDKVQITTAEFYQWNNVAGHAIPIILALFMGSWSDRRGRKLPLLIGLIGKFYYSSMIVLIAYQDSWPVEYVIYIATLPMTITGADVVIFAAAYAYITDVSSQENRTLRVTLLEVCYLATMPIGIALGSYLFMKVLNRSYAIMFIINASFLLVSIIYTALRLEWRSSSSQKPLSEASNVFTDFFDYQHLTATFNTIFKKRAIRRRSYLLLLILAMACYTFQRDEKQMSYLYFTKVLKWFVQEVSNLRTYQSALQDCVLLFGIPFAVKFCGMKDTLIIMIGCIAHAVARFFFAYGHDVWVFYVGATFAAFGPIVAPIIRSLVSKLVASAERGKVFAVLSVADNAIPLLSGVVYNLVYSNTVTSAPYAFFYVAIVTQMIVFAIVIFIQCTAKPYAFMESEEEQNERCLNEPNNQTTT